MRNYKIHYGHGNTLISTSRNARKHASDLGQDVTITTMGGKIISKAKIDSETGKPCLLFYRDSQQNIWTTNIKEITPYLFRVIAEAITEAETEDRA